MPGVKKFVRRSAGLSAQQWSNLKNKLTSEIDQRQVTANIQNKVLLEKQLLEQKNVDPAELQELLGQVKDLQVDSDQESLDFHEKNMTLTQVFLGRLLKSCSSKNVKITTENNCVKTWWVEVVPDSEYPDVVVRMKFDTLDLTKSDKLPSIVKLRIGLVGLEVDGDMAETIKLCEKDKEIQLFIRLIREYLPLSKQREVLITSSISSYVKRKSSNMVEFVNQNGQVLANLCINLKLDYSNFSWRMGWNAKLTDGGKVACKEFHIPSSLAKTGTVSDWDVPDALERLSRVALHDSEDTPMKEQRRFSRQDLSGVDTSTPRLLANKKVTKRKLINN